jgi:transposase
MSKKLFNSKEIQILQKHPFVKKVSEKAITYADEFKMQAVAEYEKGKCARSIFEEAGFDIEIVGIERAKGSLKRWRSAYVEKGELGLEDARKYASGRPRERELSLEEKLKRLEAQNRLLQAENELLKKIDLAERMLRKKK